MRIDHVAMYVNDIEKARDFFVKYLDGKSNAGYHNVKTDFRSYFISFDDGSRLEIMNRPDMTDEEKVLNRTGLIHIAFSVGRSRLEIMNRPDMTDEEKVLNRTGLIHIAFSVGSKERVDELTGRLKSAGFDIVSGPRTTGDGYYESCIIAIEGNQIEITI